MLAGPRLAGQLRDPTCPDTRSLVWLLVLDLMRLICFCFSLYFSNFFLFYLYYMT